MPPFPSLTKTYYTKSYLAIDPRRLEKNGDPSLSARGKTIIITGGGGAIGKAIALSFSQAGASTVILLGRTGSTLESAKLDIEAKCPSITIHIYTCDVTSKSSVDETFTAIYAAHGPVHILINNAGVLAAAHSVASVSAAEWWSVHQTNVLGILHACQAFLSNCAPHAQCAMINISAGLIYGPSIPTWSAYQSSKLAAASLINGIGAENPELFTLNVHPGIIESGVLEAAGGAGVVGGRENLDDAKLAGDFVVWACSTEGSFLRGRFVWANWNVGELMAATERIERDEMFLTMGLSGWPDGLG
jgi:NAD(P)-dependent dehydrogenase (short-subunit alcohol dehydrogenase family)